ncbi:MAG: MmgE/PrpD family protein [Methyloligellaceae bacterium]
MTQISKTLAQFAADLVYQDLPTIVVERCKRLVLDTAGIIICARHDAESTPAMVSAVEKLEMTGGSCAVLGDKERYRPAAAALLNGTLAHSLDFDDTHAAASLHSSAPILPAGLAAAELANASGQDLIAALVAGYEIQIRLSKALGPAEHYRRGFHPTATCGIFGAATAAGKLLGLDGNGLRNAFGIALSQAAGSLEFLNDGAWTKRSHVGQAAQNGLIAAVLSQEGYKGVEQPFEGKAGFFAAYAPNPRPEIALEGLGELWETLNLAVKPYPSCRYGHAAIDSIVALRNENDIRAEDVTDIQIGMSKTGNMLIGEPENIRHNPKNVVDGQFSMAFVAAVALREGGLKWVDYDRHLRDTETLELCRKVHTYLDDEVEDTLPNLAAKARIKTKLNSFELFTPIPKGEPDNFPSDGEFRQKFNGLCEPYLGSEMTNTLADNILNLEQANSIGTILSLSQPA